MARAQGGVPLVTVATDQSVSSSLSNQFGVPVSQAVDQAGDLVFIGDGRSGLFYRPAGAGSATRLLQTGDPVPGFPGSHVVFFGGNVSINSFGKIYFEAVFTLPDGENHQALMIYDGTSYHTIVSSESLAPPIATAPSLGGPNVTFSTTFTPLTQGINDNGDVAFTVVPDATGQQTLYIVPAGKTPLAVATVGEPSLPPFSGTFTGSAFPNPTSGLNALGQVLFSTSVVGLPGTGLFVASEANGGEVFKVASVGDTFCGGGATVSSLSSTAAVLNNLGGYAFTEQAVVSSVTQSALCVGAVGGSPTKSVGTGTAAPSPIVNGTLGVVGVNSVLALDDSGDIAFVSPITGSVTTTSALLRYTKAGGQLGVVAYNTEAAPGLSGQFLSSSFTPFSIGSNAAVAFAGATGGGVCAPADNCGAHAVYQQSGIAAPVLIATDGQGSTLTGAGTLYCPGCTIAKQLNNGSVFFDSLVQGGTAYYGQFIGASGSLQALMNTGDTLPTGSRVSLLGIIARAAGTWVGFTAQQSGGRLSLFVSNTATSTTTKAVSEGDTAPVTGGVIATANQNFFINANGGLAFNARVSGTIGGGRSAGTAIFTWSSGSGLAKAVALGDATPIVGTMFETLTLNSGAPTPFNNSGQLAFGAGFEGSTGGTGIFLYNPASGGSIAKIVTNGDAAPGGGTFTGFTSGGSIYALNQSGLVAFEASRSTGGPGFFIGAAGVPAQVVAVPGTSTSLGPITAVIQFLGFNDSGVLSFLGAASPGGEALFNGSGAPATPTPSVLAYSGQGVSGGGSLTLGSAPLNNDENDAAFLSGIINSSANTALFFDPGTGPNAGTLEPVIYQGQAAPGGGTFTTLYSPSYALGPDGELITTASHANGLYNPVELGVFLVRQNGAVARVLGAGDTVPGGGVASQVRVGQGLAAGAAGEFAFWASINGGSAQQAIFATAMPTGTTSSTVTLTSSANPAVSGGLVTLTATLATGSAGIPTGSVTFYDNGVSLGTRTLASGQAQFSTGSLLIGAHPITAQYSGDTNYAPGNSNVLDETITGPGTNATSTTLTSTPDPSAIGQAVTFTATVTSGSGTPFGTVSFFSGSPLSGVLLGSATLNGSGQATFTTSFSPAAAAQYSITAQYDGASTFAASSSTALTQTVQPPFDVIAPVINSISPNAVPAAGGAFNLIVNGTGFVSGSVVQWNGAARTTTFVSPTQLTASLSSSDISVTGWDQVTVSNASFGSLVSNAVAFQVTSGSGPTAGTALYFVPVTPCRLVDTRGAAGAFAGPSIAGGASRNFTIPQNTTCNIPSTAAAYSLNVAVVPPGPLGYVTLWPAGQAQPGVATVSSIDGRVRSNAAIVPAGAGGAISVFASNTTDLVMDINGYFTTSSAQLEFYPVTPCRVVDTRNPGGTFGGPFITGNTSRTFPLPTGSCNLPSTAQAYSLNLTVVPQVPLGYLTAWPTGQTQPGTANLSSTTGTVTSNAAIVPAGTSGSINVYASNSTDLIVDVDGYFAPAGAGGLSLYNVAPCRVLDTRQLSDTQATQPFSGELDESIQASACGVPVGAQAYVLNATVVPSVPLGFLTLWPQGTAQPLAATLSALDQTVTSNLAIVPTTNGSIATYAANPTQFIMDLFGYFAPSSQAPAIISPESATLIVGAPSSFTVTATGFPAPALTESGTLPAGVTFTDNGNGTATIATAAGFGPGSVGMYDLKITASNGVGANATQTFGLAVDIPPAFTSGNNATFLVGTAGSFTVAATGFPAPGFVVSGTLPSGVSFNPLTGVLSGTPSTGAGGVYPLAFTALNGSGFNPTQSFTLTVNEAPTITSVTSVTFTTGNSQSFTVTATGYPAPTFAESGTLPAGLSSFNTTTGVLSGTPTVTGVFPITFTAHNATGTSPVQNFTLTVNAGLPSVTVVVPGTIFANGNIENFNITVTSDQVGDVLTPTLTLNGGACSPTICGTLGSVTGASGNYSVPYTPPTSANLTATTTFTITVSSSLANSFTGTATFNVNPAGVRVVTVTGIGQRIAVSAAAPANRNVTVYNDSGTTTGATLYLVASGYTCPIVSGVNVCGKLVIGTPTTGTTTTGTTGIPFTTIPFTYTAPAAIPNPPYDRPMILAVSNADPTKVAQANFEFDAPQLPITPLVIANTSRLGTPLTGSTSTTLTATLTGDTGNSKTVNWTLAAGGVPCTAPCSNASGTLGTPAYTRNGTTVTATVAYTPPATVPSSPANTPTITATSVDSPTATDTFSFNIVDGTCGTGNESILNGQYAFLIKGGAATNGYNAVIGSFTANGVNGNGLITAGLEDVNRTTGVLTNLTLTGTYSVGSDNRGCMTLTNSNGGVATYRFALGTISGNVATQGSLQGFTDTTGEGARTEGIVLLQNSSAFNPGAIEGTYVFGRDGVDVAGGRYAVAGLSTADGVSKLSNITADFVDYFGGAANLPGPGTGTFSIATNAPSGRGTFATTIATGTSGSVTSNFAIYVVSPSEILSMSTDPVDATHPIQSGEVKLQSGTFTQTSLDNKNYVFYGYAIDGSNGGNVTDLGQSSFTTNGNATTTFDQNDNGISIPEQVQASAFTIAANGRTTISGGGGQNPLIYLVDSTQGFLVGTDSSAILGYVQQQSASSFTTSTISGTYFFGGTAPNTGSNTDTGAATFTPGSSTISGTDDSAGPNYSTQGCTGNCGGLYPNQSIGGSTYNFSTGSTVPGQGNVGTNSLAYIISPTKLIFMQTGTSTNTNPAELYVIQH
jgi:hypothetical protein